MHDAADIGRWLALLRDGSEAEQQLARTELGLILEARGLLDEATAAYAQNVQDGVADRRPYERLAAIARLRGDVAEEARLLRALADLLAPPLLPEDDAFPSAPQPPTAIDTGDDAERSPSPQTPPPGTGEGETAPERASFDLDE
ncbi:MAG: hypothetical protein AB7P40_20945, partial [Chloroflexota bacterium]